MTALCDPKRDALNVCLRVVGTDKEKLDQKAGGFGPNQNVYFARVRHHRLEAEAALRFDAGVTPAIGDNLRLSHAFVVGALTLARDIVGIDISPNSMSL